MTYEFAQILCKPINAEAQPTVVYRRRRLSTALSTALVDSCRTACALLGHDARISGDRGE
jgi:hypothetical protein